jgi:dTMP kinase
VEGARVYRPLVPEGVLITIEGIDGAGKSTLAAALQRELAAEGRPVVLLRDPGGPKASERMRALVKDPSLVLVPRAEVLLYAAARSQLVQESIEPALARGEIVIVDRFVDSSLAYQGAGRGLGVEAVSEINRFATGGVRPDRTLLLRIAPAAGRARHERRAGPPDRLEGEGDGFFQAIASAYEELAREEPERFAVLDASLPAEEVLAAARSALVDLLAAPG